MKKLITNKTYKLTSCLTVVALLYISNAQSITLQKGECFYQSDKSSTRFLPETTLIFSWEVDDAGKLFWKPNRPDSPVANYSVIQDKQFSEYSKYVFEKNGKKYLSGSEIKLVNIVLDSPIMNRQATQYSAPNKINTLKLSSSQISDTQVQLWLLNPLQVSGMSEAAMVCKVTNEGVPSNSLYTKLNQIGTCFHQVTDNNKDKYYAGSVISWRVYKDGSIWWKAGDSLEYNLGSWSQVPLDNKPQYADGGIGLGTMKFKGYLPIELGQFGQPKTDDNHTWTVKIDTTSNKTAMLSRVKLMQKYEYPLNCTIVNNPQFPQTFVKKPDETKEPRAGDNSQGIPTTPTGGKSEQTGSNLD